MREAKTLATDLERISVSDYPNIGPELYRIAVTYNPVVIYALDKHGVFMLSDGLGLKRLGLAPGEAVGRSALEMYREYPDIINAMKRALTGETVIFSHQVGRAFFDHRMIPFFDQDGSVAGIVGTATDITEMKENERSLKEKEDSLQQSYDELTALHEELTATEEELRAQYEELLQMNQQVIKQNSVLTALEETAFSLVNQLDMDELLQRIVKRATYLVDAQDAFITLAADDGVSLKLLAGIGLYGTGSRVFRPDCGLMGKVFASGRAEMVEEYFKWPGRADEPGADRIYTLFAMPLFSKQRVAGVLGIAYRQPERKFGEHQKELLQRFAALASLTIENASLHAGVQHELNERVKSETTLNEIFNGVNEVIIVNNPADGGILWANRQAAELFGYTEEELRRHGAVLISKTENFAAALTTMRRAMTDGPQFYERITTDKNGRLMILEINAKRAVIHGKEVCLTIMRDVTGRKQIETALLQTETEKQAVLNAVPDTMLIFDQAGHLLDYKLGVHADIAFYPVIQEIGKNIRDGKLPERVIKRYLYCIDQAIQTERLQLCEYILEIQGKKLYREVRFNKIGPDRVLAILRDITEMRLFQEQVEFLSRHDVMTGIFDRTYFEEALRSRWYKKDHGVAIVMCDVDGLKLINDTLGHAAGDHVLKVVASALGQSFTADTDVVARIGGDEFAVITYCEDNTAVEMKVEGFLQIISKYRNSNPHLPVSVSVGWAADYSESTNVTALLKEADHTMYRKKLHQSQSMRSSIVHTMMKALEARDYITEGHADRLQEAVEKLGRLLGLAEAKLADLRLFAQFHDIGKVGVPDHILNKPSKLTTEEFAIMKRHSDIGYRIALASPDLSPIAGLILKHHEWWSGDGYPLGIRGEEIPMECRILALADAYDAMTNDRPYRAALSSEDAKQEIRRFAGKQFDPALAEMFITLIETEMN